MDLSLYQSRFLRLRTQLVEETEGTEVTDSQEERRNGDERRAVRLVGVRRTPTAAMYESPNTNRPNAISGLYWGSRTSQQAAFGGQSNGRRSSCASCPFWQRLRSSPFLRSSCESVGSA